jgi:ATP-dependent DNA helicase RecG
MDEHLAEGLALASGGFAVQHPYPMRVVKEAIVNAVIHRDYRLNRDIFVRIFDNRVEIESPGAFPGAITAANIASAGSKARNPLIARTLFDFPVRPNIDAGEGVRMMFAEMAQSGLYPPQYRESVIAAGNTVTVTLLNDSRPVLWEQVSDWIDRSGPIANCDLCALGRLDTLKASRMLKRWVDQGLLEPLPGRGKRNTAYRKPMQGTLLSSLEDNKQLEIK